MFRTVVLAVCAGAALAGCSASVTLTTEPTIDKATLEKGITDTLTKKVGQRPDAVECPIALKVKVGETTRCALTANGVRYGVTATITSVQGANYHYDVQVDDQRLPSS